MMVECTPIWQPSKQLGARSGVRNVTAQIVLSALLGTAMPLTLTWSDPALRLRAR